MHIDVAAALLSVVGSLHLTRCLLLCGGASCSSQQVESCIGGVCGYMVVVCLSVRSLLWPWAMRCAVMCSLASVGSVVARDYTTTHLLLLLLLLLLQDELR